MSELRIGCSGWTYKDWKGPFYPADVKDRARLEYYATRFDTAEINASFYRLPSEATVRGWAERAPPGFVFAWKVSRFITHNKKLKDCEDPVALVYGSEPAPSRSAETAPLSRNPRPWGGRTFLECA